MLIPTLPNKLKFNEKLKEDGVTVIAECAYQTLNLLSALSGAYEYITVSAIILGNECLLMINTDSSLTNRVGLQDETFLNR